MVNKNHIIVEVLEEMKPSIQKGVKNTTFQEREDLDQEIAFRLVQKTREMEVVSFWEFKKQYDNREKI
ncbi:hypothetical protein LF817_19225 [Halobacillus sp. A1]|uniref:hypothetical protein n=1 Tax=Halobacillus sp. A1 TaxID=2880262 RepID=UPI0020A6B8E4|nr:hypothetical protein [Halobacillus sp. A1]MCP3033461.1 hypothetical protein [Halobacillus sp. A1]